MFSGLYRGLEAILFRYITYIRCSSEVNSLGMRLGGGGGCEKWLMTNSIKPFVHGPHSLNEETYFWKYFSKDFLVIFFEAFALELRAKHLRNGSSVKHE